MTVDATVVGTLRVHGGDPAAAARELGRVSLRPESMPARAVLVLRHLDDPLPGVLGTAASPTWERAARSALDARLREAARPSAGPVPAGAIAVLFEDRSQLLAALAADWMAGSLGNHWWWREFVRSRVASDAVIQAWMRDARATPAALGLLADRGGAAAFARALPPSAVSSLTVAVLRAWGAPQPAVTAAEGMTGTAAAAGAGPPAPLVPWASGAAEAADAGLTRAARLLLGVGLSLARAPATASRAVFWTSVRAWLEAPADAPVRPGPAPDGHARRPAGHRVATLRDAAGGAAGQQAAAAAGARPGAAGRRLEPARRPGSLSPPGPAGDQDGGNPVQPARGITGSLPRATPPGSAPGRYPPDRSAKGPDRPRIPAGRADDRPAGQPRRVAVAGVTGPPPDAGPALTADGEQAHPVTAAWRVDTAFAGLFFLLNVALNAGLYGDFTRPATPGIPVSPWHLVALLGEQLLYPGAKRAGPNDEDPVWALLARLAGPAEPAIAGRRPSSAAPRALRRWVRRLAGRLRPELSLALGCTPDAVGDVLLRHPGRVEATATHVDVMLSLAGLPIEVRLAGLDRDPGWIPAAGRTVAFHFD